MAKTKSVAIGFANVTALAACTAFIGACKSRSFNNVKSAQSDDKFNTVLKEYGARIERDTLILKDGRTFPRIRWKSELGAAYYRRMNGYADALVVDAAFDEAKRSGARRCAAIEPVPVVQEQPFLPPRSSRFVIAQQAKGAGARLMFMNTESTQSQTLEVRTKKKYPEIFASRVPFDFLQFDAPKLDAGTRRPVSYPKDPAMEWYPPGHGSVYAAFLLGENALDKLLEAGVRYAFVSNSDNLGATIDPRIYGAFIESKAPFLMEVTRRTPQDSKGGHLAKSKDGRLLLREGAQVPNEDQAYFQAITRHRFFNTNNIWIDLQALKETLRSSKGVLPLPLIVNAGKTVDPADRASPGVVQLETAMAPRLVRSPRPVPSPFPVIASLP